MPPHNNPKSFDAGIQKMTRIKHEHFIKCLQAYCDSLFRSADAQRQYRNLTGNTFVSYSCGIYIDGTLREILLSSDYKKPPIRVKLAKGEVFSGKDYDGTFRRKYKANIETDRGLGVDTSLRFLRQHKPNVTKGYDVVMCTGTEYSEYIEKVRHINVLTNTYLMSSGLIAANLKPIPNS